MAERQGKGPRVAVTAGLRGASWDPSRMQEPYTMTPFPLGTQDGQFALGFLFARGKEKRAVLSMHPRELLLTHYLVPDVLNAGWGFRAAQPRSVRQSLRPAHGIPPPAGPPGHR